MDTKKFKSYQDIEDELEILHLNRDISYERLLLSINKTKQSFTPQNIINGFLDPYKNLTTHPVLKIAKVALPFIISFIMKRRG